MKKIIVLERRFIKCNNVITLGVKPSFSKYTSNERKLISSSKKIYYPSYFYAGFFEICGKSVFPTLFSYYCSQDKIKQTVLFKINKIPHPKTGIFYGKKQKEKITNNFSYPFIAKIPRGSSRGGGVFLIKNKKDLTNYLNFSHISYVQEYLPIKKDIRVVVIGNKVIHCYWRNIKFGEYRGNLKFGAEISFDRVPCKVLELAYLVTLKCGWDDVGIDICEYNGRYYVLEANMKYGHIGFNLAGLDYFKIVDNMIENGEI